MKRHFLVLPVLAVTGILTLAMGAPAATAASGHPATHGARHIAAPGSRPASARPGPRSVIRPDGVYSVPVYPRLSVPGCSRQDGYNGNVEWGTFPNPQFVKTWGELWDVCGVTAHLYMSWYDPDYENAPVATTPPLITTGVNQSYSTAPYNPGYISVTVCANTINGWTCGSPYKA